MNFMKSKSTAVFKITHQWLLSWEKWISSTIFHLIYLWLILTSTLRSSKNSLSLQVFPSQYSTLLSFLTFMLMRRPPHLPLLGHPNSHEQDSVVYVTIYHTVSRFSRGAVKLLAITIWNYHFQAVSCLYKASWSMVKVLCLHGQCQVARTLT